MPWKEVTTLTLRRELVTLAQQEGCNISELCRRFNISRKTAYKWLKRFAASDEAGLVNQSRRPLFSPSQTPQTIEDAVLELRGNHPSWGGRKLKVKLEEKGLDAPAASTITSILRRNDLIDPVEAAKHIPFISFEHPYPNSLWQMDFKGHFPTLCGRCHPLTVLDDHSRFSICLKACFDEKAETVKDALICAFRRYGLPDRMTMDNGSPWGGDGPNELTALTVWLIRIGVRVSHSRPYHPQTQGKDERFHRTLNRDAIQGVTFRDLLHCQRRFDQFREIYNLERPHESLGMKPPVTRYLPSPRPYPETLSPIEYQPGDCVRKVQDKGIFSFQGREHRVARGLKGWEVAIRPTETDGKFAIYFCHQKVGEIDIH